MTGPLLAVRAVALSTGEARALTDEVKADAAALWRKLLRLYEGGAHTALGYGSWAEYCAEEFDIGKSHAYRLLDAGRVHEVLDSPHSPNWGISGQPLSEGIARELVPVMREDEREVVEVWRELCAEHGNKLTAEKVRLAVAERLQRERTAEHTRRTLGSSASVEWGTPRELFAELDAEFGFEVDVCATPGMQKCEHYYSPDDDGLAQDWTGVCFMNPPYGVEIPPWVAKAHEAARNGATVVALVPARVDTEWWWEHCRHAEIRFLRGRLTFEGAQVNAPFPSAVVVFGREPRVVWWDWKAAA